MGLRAARKATSHGSVANADTDSMAAVRRVEVRRIVVIVEDRNRDAEEAADNGHKRNLALEPGRSLPST